MRGGVAPDHPKIKSVSRVYEKTAAHPEFRFFGNVESGGTSPTPTSSALPPIVYAVGAQTDRRMGIPGEDLPAAGRPPSSSPGTTAIPTTATSSSTCPASARS